MAMVLRPESVDTEVRGPSAGVFPEVDKGGRVIVDSVVALRLAVLAAQRWTVFTESPRIHMRTPGVPDW
jgi:hypothetical protein